MLGAGSLFIIGTSLFLVYVLVVTVERRRGQRIMLSGVRGWLDASFDAVYQAVAAYVRRVVRHTIKLSWYYSIHKALRAILTLLVALYDRLELVFQNNRERAKKLRAERRALNDEKNHLTVIGEHKASTALTSKEKKKLKDKSLAGK